MINSKEQIIEYFKSGIKQTKDFKIGIEHEKFLFDKFSNKRIDYPKIKKISDVYRPIYTKCIHLKFYRSLDYENMYKSLVDTIEKRIQL